jgi:hypothetical protein
MAQSDKDACPNRTCARTTAAIDRLPVTACLTAFLSQRPPVAVANFIELWIR